MATPADHSIILLLTAISGAVVLLGTMLLIGMRRIYIDKETNQPTEFEFPLLGKMKTQTPALFLIAVGCMLSAYSGYQAAALSKQSVSATVPGTLDGEIQLDGAKATVLVLAVPSQYQHARQSSGKFSLALQLLPNSDYQVKYEVDQYVFPVQADFSNNHIRAHPFHYMHSTGSDELPLDVQTQKEGLSDAELKKLDIIN
jgi:hypothetical protein